MSPIPGPSYRPQIGDRVRVTFEGIVEFGYLDSAGDPAFIVRQDDDTDWHVDADQATFERVEPQGSL